MDYYTYEGNRFDYLHCMKCSWEKRYVTDSEFMRTLEQFRSHYQEAHHVS